MKALICRGVAIVLGLLGLLVVPECVREARRLSRLGHEALHIDAEITRIEEVSSSEDASDPMRNRVFEQATVRYSVSGKQYESRHHLPEPIRRHKPGDTIVILALPDEPWRSYAAHEIPGSWITSFMLPAVLLGSSAALWGVGALLGGTSDRPGPASTARKATPTRRSRKSVPEALAHPSLPYVVRFGPWARNLYLGLPAALAFGLVAAVAEMPTLLLVVWNGVVALVVIICGFPRETRFESDGTVVVVTRFLALLPVWRRRYPRSALRAIRLEHASFGFSGEAEVSASTVWLLLQTGGSIPIQSYSDGADNQPPAGDLIRDLREITGLPIA